MGHCIGGEQDYRQETCSSATLPKVAVLPSSGVAGVHKGKRGLYRAKISVSGIILYSRYSTLQDAVGYQTTLTLFNKAVTGQLRVLAEAETQLQEMCPNKTEPQSGHLRTAFLAALAESPTRDGFAQADIRMYLSLHVAKWLGSVHVTSPVVSAPEALFFRERLLRARELGWESFRQVWVELLQFKGNSSQRQRRRGALCALAPVEAHVESAFQRVCSSQKGRTIKCKASRPASPDIAKVKSPKQSGAACQSELSIARLDCRLARTIASLQRALVSCRRSREL